MKIENRIRNIIENSFEREEIWDKEKQEEYYINIFDKEKAIIEIVKVIELENKKLIEFLIKSIEATFHQTYLDSS